MHRAISASATVGWAAY